MIALSPTDREYLEQRERLLPPALVPVFDERFIRSAALYDEFVTRLAAGIVREAGLEAHLEAGPATTEAIVARAGIAPDRGLVPLDWVFRQLAEHGLLERTAADGAPARFRLARPFPALDPSEPEAEQRAVDPSWAPSYEIAKVAARGYPAFLQGRVTGEEGLFSPECMGRWFEYFHNDNRLYVVNNIVGALCAEERLRPGGGLRILEIGGGLGSAALALLERLERSGRLADLARYDFTELVPAFLRRGQRALGARFGEPPFLASSRLDMNKPFAEQGIDEGGVDLIYAVNTIHVAHDLAFTLGEVRRALAPGGAVVISECIRPFPGRAIYAELVFNLMESFRAPLLDPRYRPNGGFLTPEQWTLALESNGFTDVRFVPDILTIRKKHPLFYAAAAGATRT